MADNNQDNKVDSRLGKVTKKHVEGFLKLWDESEKLHRSGATKVHTAAELEADLAEGRKKWTENLGERAGRGRE